jgi:predicted cupin superfamily sugar epimerase
MVTSEQLISLLNLKLLSQEGGYFIETYRSSDSIPQTALPDGYCGERSFGTAIYYLLTPDSFSAMHRLIGDEVFHFYLGDPVEMLQLWPDGSGRVVTLGQDILNGQQPQVIVPKGIWQGARLISGGKFALMGTTVAPGFDYVDYEHGKREDLIQAYPKYREMIMLFTYR